MTLETFLWIISITGFAVIAISISRPRAQSAANTFDETLSASWESRMMRQGLDRWVEVSVEDNALRMLLEIDAQVTTVAESATRIREMMHNLLPEYAESTVDCGAGSVIQLILMARSYFGEPLPQDLASKLILWSAINDTPTPTY